MGWPPRSKVLFVVAGVALVIGTVCAFADLPAVWTWLTGRDGEDGALAVGDQLASVGSFLLAALTTWLALDQRRGAAPAPVPAATFVRRAVESFVDRRGERRKLRRALRSRRSRVIVVLGPAGVGKTELVTRVLDDLRIEPFPLPYPSIDGVITAVEAAGGFATTAATRDESALGRLQAAVEKLGAGRAVIVIDPAVALQDEEGRLTDLALDEALEALATSSRPGVKVVLITQREPHAHAGGCWSTATPISVGGLPLDYFRAFVRDAAVPELDGMASLDEPTFNALYSAFGGRPRLAQLFDAIVENSDQSATSLAAALREWTGPSPIAERLLRELSAVLRSDRLRVYRAVAAFAVPVDAATVAALVDAGLAAEEQLGETWVAQLLRALSPHAIHRISDGNRYYLPETEASRVLDWRSETDPVRVEKTRRLLAGAARLLRQRRQEPSGTGRPAPEVALAEVEAWLRANVPEQAYRSIGELDPGSRTHPDPLFRGPRARIADHIEPGRLDNYNVLGFLYHVAGDFGRSARCYREVLRLAGDIPLVRAPVLVNLGWLAWSEDRVADAFADFGGAYELAGADPVAAAGALEGMARCQRRRGRFREAVTLTTRALDVVGQDARRRTSVAVQLARLYVDTDDGRADNLLDRLREEIRPADDPALWAEFLDVRADSELARGELTRALPSARQAVDAALAVNDPVTLLQARTTICLIRLREKDWRAALREATLAERYRGMERSLFVLALLGVAGRRLGRRDGSRRAFDRLASQASIRINGDSGRVQGDKEDFLAREMLGLARCAQHLDGDGPVEAAEQAFEAAWHKQRDPAPVLTGHLILLVDSLTDDPAKRAQLRPVLEVLRRQLRTPSAG